MGEVSMTAKQLMQAADAISGAKPTMTSDELNALYRKLTKTHMLEVLTAQPPKGVLPVPSHEISQGVTPRKARLKRFTPERLATMRESVARARAARRTK